MTDQASVRLELPPIGETDPRLPLYQQIYDVVRRQIDRSPDFDGVLPTEAEIAQHFRVSRITVRHALNSLESDGYIEKRRAKPAQVVAHRGRWPFDRQVSSIEDMLRGPGGRRRIVTSFTRVPAGEIGEILGLAPDVEVVCLRTIQVWQDEPIGYSVFYFHPVVGDRLHADDFNDDEYLVFRTLERRLGIVIDSARLTVSAEDASAEAAGVLGCAPGESLLVHSITMNTADGRVVEYARNHYIGHRYTLSYEVGRSSFAGRAPVRGTSG